MDTSQNNLSLKDSIWLIKTNIIFLLAKCNVHSTIVHTRQKCVEFTMH